MQDLAILCFRVNSQTYNNFKRQSRLQKQTIINIKSRKFIIKINNRLQRKTHTRETQFIKREKSSIENKNVATTIRNTSLIAEEESNFPQDRED